jgi:hypothetical protein
MTLTVEATTIPVSNGDWTMFYEVLSDIPGSMLIEDPEQPTLVIPTDCDAPDRAFAFVSGLATVTGLTLVEAKAYETPEDDSDLPENDADAAPMPDSVARVRDWVASIPQNNDSSRMAIPC